MDNLLKMVLDTRHLEHPIACSDCGADAGVIFFERFRAPGPGIGLAMRKKYAKCWSHLTMEENHIRGVETV